MKLDDLRKKLQRPKLGPKVPEAPEGLPCECCDKRATLSVGLVHPKIVAFKCESCKTTTVQLPPIDAPALFGPRPNEVTSFMDGIELKLGEDGRVHFHTNRRCHCGSVMAIGEHSGHYWIECPKHPNDNV